MNKMFFDKSYLLNNLKLPKSDNVLEDTLVTVNGVFARHKLVFKDGSNFYMTYYDEYLRKERSVWDGLSTIMCYEVLPIMEQRVTWVPVNMNN